MKIYYIQDALGGFETFRPYWDTIKKLETRGSSARGLNLEKLRTRTDPAIYSIRINASDRILLVKYKGQYCLIDVVLNHDYKKSRFLNDPSLFKRLLAQSSTVVDSPLEALHDGPLVWDRIEAVYDEPIAAAPYSVIQALEYQQHRFIELNTEQEEALHTSLPAIVSGPAGSGKSSVALSMLSQYLRNHGEDTTAFPVVYVTQSIHLVNEMRRIWQDILPDPARFSLVDFKTYDQVIAEGLGISEDHFVGEAEFLAMYPSMSKPFKGSAISAKEAWQECRIRSGYPSDDAYLELGYRQSHLNRDDRIIICSAYHSFIKQATARGLMIPVLDQLIGAIRTLYKLYIVDEAQDFSYGQLYRLKLLSKLLSGVYSIVFFLGDHQILFDGKSRLNYLKSLFHADVPAKIIELNKTQRCSEAVTLIANALIRIKYGLTGGASDKLSKMLEVANSASTVNGAAYRFQCHDIKQIDTFAQQASASLHYVVITVPDYVEEAKRIFRTPLVFTAEQVKGLEFNTVILWRILDTDESKKAAQSLCLSQSSSGHRPKAGIGDESFEPYCNRLITAVTRARHHVVMFENNSRHIAPLLSVLDQAFEKAQHIGPLFSETLSSSASDWALKAKELYATGHETQARAIFIEKIGGSATDFHLFIEGLSSPSDASSSSGYACAGALVSIKKEVAVDCSTSKVSATIPTLPSSMPLALEEHRLIKTIYESKDKATLLANRENFIVLRHMSNEVFASIPADSWLAWIGKKRTLRPLLIDLAADAEQGIFILKRLLENGLMIPQKSWDFTAGRDHVFFPETSIPYWLLMHAQGQLIFNELFSKKDSPVIKMSTFFLLSSPIGREGLSPLAMLIASKPGLKLLRVLIKNNPKLFQSISKKIWASPHPSIKAMNGQPLTLINSFQAHPDGLKLLKLLRPHLCDFADILNRVLCDPWSAVVKNDINTLRTLHGLGFDLTNMADEEGITPIHLAAQLGQVDILQGLGDIQINLNREDHEGETPAEYAIKYKQLDVLRKLHHCGVDLNQETTHNMSPALLAAELGDIHILKVLYECGINLNRESKHASPAYIATELGHLDILKMLYDYYPDIDTQELIYLSSQTEHLNIMEFLSEQGTIQCTYIFTTQELIDSLRENSAELTAKVTSLIARLVAEGQNKDNLRLYPIDIARLFGHEGMVNLLASKIQAEKMRKKEPEYSDEGQSQLQVVTKIGQFELNKALSFEGAALESVWAAAYRGDLATLIKLYKRSIDLNAPDAEGNTPAIIATLAGHSGVLKFLYDCGINLYTETKRGATPAYVAVVTGQLPALRMIIELCPEVDAKKLFFLGLQTNHLHILEFLGTQDIDFNNPYSTSVEELISISKDDKDIAQRMTQIIRELVTSGQKPNCLRILPVDFARAYGHEKIIDFLRSKTTTRSESTTVASSSEKPHIGTSRRQLGLWESLPSSARSSARSTASDDPHSLEASGGFSSVPR